MKKYISTIIFIVIVSTSLFAQKLEFIEKSQKANDYANLNQPEKVLLVFETDLNLHFKSSMENLIEPIKEGKTYQLFITQTKCIITISDQDENKADISFGNLGATFPPLNKGDIKYFEISLTYPLKYIEQTEQKKKEGRVDNQMLYEKEALIIFTVDPPDLKLQFLSTEKITDTINESGLYKLFLKPVSQTITIKYPGLDDTHILFESLTVKEVRYFYVILPNKFRNIQTETTDKNISVGSYRIETDPPGAFIEMYGNPAFNSQKNKAPFTFEGYETGPKILTIKLPEYEPVTDTIQIGTRKANKSKYKLIPEFAFVNFSISPSPPVSKLFINDIEKIDFQNGQEYKVGKGDVSVVVKADHYYPASKIINTIAGKVHDFSIELKPIMGSITILPGENADGAEVFIDEKNIGKLPIQNYAIQEGDYKITFRKKGLVTTNDSYDVSIKENSLYTLKNIKMIDLVTVKISSEPVNGATVFINGKDKGTTPLNIKLPVGSYKLLVKKTNFETIEKNINLQVDLPIFEFNMKPIWNLEVNTNPQSSLVYVDNVLLQGLTPNKYKIMNGFHTISLENDNYATRKVRMNITDKPQEITRKLKASELFGFGISIGDNGLPWAIEAFTSKNKIDFSFAYGAAESLSNSQNYDTIGTSISVQIGYRNIYPFDFVIHGGLNVRSFKNESYSSGSTSSTEKEYFFGPIFGLRIPFYLTRKMGIYVNSEFQPISEGGAIISFSGGIFSSL